MSARRQWWQCKGCKGPPILGDYQDKPWIGPCPHCGRTRDAARVSVSDDGPEDGVQPIEEGQVITLSDAIRNTQNAKRLAPIQSGSAGVDWVLGGGIPPAIAILLASPPGGGKTTFLIETLRALALKRHRVLFLSSEESTTQLGRRFGRFIGEMPARLRIASLRDLDEIEEVIKEERPRFCAIDSLHKISGVSDDAGFTYSTGSNAAITNACDRLRALTGPLNMTAFFVAHVSKEGGIAGANTLQHDVDAILYLNGEQKFVDGRSVIFGKERTLRCDGKGRFGETGRCARFQMTSDGLHDLGPWMYEHPPWKEINTHE